ncbi:HD-GYP domain-containing protein [Sedimenticola selenatireducens]|uniref:HD-GYP domain-containing protein n=1 Tax=Sedimenticola selenatireducens TaxID=191960 RepID=A0A2N6CTT4_9GAMM|nr:HD domain-containing phosphohydrolase [Sedimenticola selenatireducens]PLX60583.1 MAG: hypothetical protein C0630_14115 [Sedimenticola selenatireducens]
MNIPESNYLQQVAELGEMQTVVCTEHIQSADGARLLPKGATLNRQVIKRLLSHKLLKPIDFTTRIEDAVDHHTLTRLGCELMARESEMGTLLRMMRGEGFIRQSCSRIHLETPIQNKLTVAQKLHPELLEHSLRVALAITIIGEQLGLPEKELEVLATAGMLHDLGELHLGISNLPLEQNLNLDYWQQVRSHPVIGAMILEQFPAYKPHVSRSVREHHERLDGSGYPHRLSATTISRAGRLLSFTELAMGALKKYSLRQLSTIIKTNLDALDPQPVGIFLNALHLFQSQNPPRQAEARDENIISLFRLVSKLVIGAETITDSLESGSGRTSPCLLGPAMEKIQQTMRRAGFDLHNTEATLQMIDNDPATFIELEELLLESIYQLRKTLLEMHRHNSDPGPENQEAIRQWVEDAEHHLENAAGLLL